MKSSLIIAAAVTSCILASPSLAQEFDAGSYALAQNRTFDDVVRSLENSGYTVTDITTTMLGRVRINAGNGVHQREVVVSRSTGEVLSDIVVSFDDDAQANGPRAQVGPFGFSISGQVTIGRNWR